MARLRRSDVVRPSWLWFLVLDGGIVVLTALAFNRRAYAGVEEARSSALPPREVLQALVVGTAVIHAAEAMGAGRRAKRHGLEPRGWRLQTFVVGFPSLFALRRAARAARAGTSTPRTAPAAPIG